MFLRANHRDKDGKRHTYWSLVETVRTPDGPRQQTVCHLGELNDSAQARGLKTIEVFNEVGGRHQLKLFPSDIAPPPDDAEVAQVLIQRVRLERMRQLGPCLLGLTLWRQLQLDEFFRSEDRATARRCRGGAGAGPARAAGANAATGAVPVGAHTLAAAAAGRVL